jgi:hypothetical protein
VISTRRTGCCPASAGTSRKHLSRPLIGMSGRSVVVHGGQKTGSAPLRHLRFWRFVDGRAVLAAKLKAADVLAHVPGARPSRLRISRVSASAAGCVVASGTSKAERRSSTRGPSCPARAAAPESGCSDRRLRRGLLDARLRGSGDKRAEGPQSRLHPRTGAGGGSGACRRTNRSAPCTGAKPTGRTLGTTSLRTAWPPFSPAAQTAGAGTGAKAGPAPTPRAAGPFSSATASSTSRRSRRPCWGRDGRPSGARPRLTSSSIRIAQLSGSWRSVRWLSRMRAPGVRIERERVLVRPLEGRGATLRVASRDTHPDTRSVLLDRRDALRAVPPRRRRPPGLEEGGLGSAVAGASPPQESDAPLPRRLYRSSSSTILPISSATHLYLRHDNASCRSGAPGHDRSRRWCG